MQDGRVIVKSSDKMRSTGGRNGKPLQNYCSENPMNSMKRQIDLTLEDQPSTGQKVSNMLLGKSRGQLLMAPERMKWLGQAGNVTLMDLSGGKSKVQCYKKNIA